MHVILISDRLGKTFSFQLRRWHGGVLAATLLTVLGGSGLLGFNVAALLTPAANGLSEVASSAAQNLQIDQLALRVGELQARLARLSAIGERVANKAGLPINELSSTATPGQGGPLEAVSNATLGPAEINQLLDSLGAQFGREADKLQIIDTALLDRQVRQGSLPMDKPVEASSFQSSHFGLRTDPFTGRLARHKGLDYSDAVGAPILAAETGIVIAAEHHPQYGNVVDIDHGNGLVTRYGHADLLMVKRGDVVKRGQKIAEVGSSGRSTGPHLHFEVLKNGVQQNPAGFLKHRG